MSNLRPCPLPISEGAVRAAVTRSPHSFSSNVGHTTDAAIRANTRRLGERIRQVHPERARP